MTTSSNVILSEAKNLLAVTRSGKSMFKIVGMDARHFTGRKVSLSAATRCRFWQMSSLKRRKAKCV
jgi:hypothetical protein